MQISYFFFFYVLIIFFLLRFFCFGSSIFSKLLREKMMENLELFVNNLTINFFIYHNISYFALILMRNFYNFI